MTYKTEANISYCALALKISELGYLVPNIWSSKAIVITMLDSTPLTQPTEWAVWLRKSFTTMRVLQSGLAITNVSTKSLFGGKLFTHYDELYLFNSLPETFSVAEHFTPDRACFSDGLPNSLQCIFTSNPELVLYCSDGDFMNVAWNNNLLPDLKQILSNAGN